MEKRIYENRGNVNELKQKEESKKIFEDDDLISSIDFNKIFNLYKINKKSVDKNE